MAHSLSGAVGRQSDEKWRLLFCLKVPRVPRTSQHLRLDVQVNRFRIASDPPPRRLLAHAGFPARKRFGDGEIAIRAAGLVSDMASAGGGCHDLHRGNVRNDFNVTNSNKEEQHGIVMAARSVSTGTIGRFLVPEPLPKRLLYIEPLRRRMRVRFGGNWIADSENALLLFEPGHWTNASHQHLCLDAPHGLLLH